MDQVIGGFVCAAGLLAAGIGVLMGQDRWHSARRAHQKVAALYETMPEGWSCWFVGGFSGLTAATRFLWAFAAWAGWTLAGVGLAGLGLRLLL